MVVRNIDDDVRNVKRNCKVLIPFKKCVTDMLHVITRSGRGILGAGQLARASGVTPVIASSLRSSM